LVTAHTGSGKTLPAEFAIEFFVKSGKRVIYTSPIKALSNQKYSEFSRKYPHISFGLLTGDIKINPDADVLIMTTEILMNALFLQTQNEELKSEAKSALQFQIDIENDLACVVFDEVHYINDRDRGKVWEECLTLLSPSINLVLLSATIENPSKFAGWLGDIKNKRIHLISTEYRVVPLSHQLPNKEVMLDSKDVFNRKAYIDWFNKFYGDRKEERLHKERVAARQEGEDVVKRNITSTSFVDRMNKLITEMDLPALFFVFSRKLCVDLAKKVSTQLIDSSDAAAVRHIVKFHLHRYPHLEKSAQYYDLLSLLEKGVAYHHSGLLPVLKEIVEILFGRGFIKVLFATETFAVGINMPTKTVVFTSYRKYDDTTDIHRMLTPSEYTQMAGRAGRRGKDDKGIVIYLPMRDPEPPLLIEQMMLGRKSELSSKMDFHYSYILSVIQSGKDIINDSYWASEMREIAAEIQEKINVRKSELTIFDYNMLPDLATRATLEDKFANSVNAEKKKFQAELGRWNNTHMHPKWDTAWKNFKRSAAVLREIDNLNLAKEKVEDFNRDIAKRETMLTITGFLDNDGLTSKGILASEIHEAHPLLMSHAFYTKILHDKPTDEIVKCLSVFLEDVRTEDTIQKCEFHLQLDKYAREFSDMEILKSDPAYWNLTSYWYDAVDAWMKGDDFICEQLGIEQGNFVRAMLKLSNIIDEWVNISTISQDVEMVEKMNDVKNLIVRSFVIPDSLYLRI
jgi:superfamily II RNA helicase